MNKLLFILFLIFNSLLLSGQKNTSVSGTVNDSKTINPIENAEIIIKETNKGTISDASGYFEINNIVPGKYNIVVKYLGYKDLNKKINLKPEENKKLKLYLIQEIKDLNEFVVEGQDETDLVISKLPYIKTKIVKRQIEENAARDIGDFLRLSNNIGGIRKGGAALDPVVRGLKYSRLNVQINNGLKIEGGCPNRMDPATAHVEIEDLESIEVFKGPYALKYGPSFGGVINLKTKLPKKSDSAYFRINALKGYESNWNGNKEHIDYSGGNKFIFLNVFGGRKDYGNYKDGNGNEVKSEFTKYNYGGQLGFIPFKKHTIILNYEESKGRDVSFPTLPMDERTDDTRLVSVDYNASELSDIFNSISVKLYKSDVKHEMDNKNRPFSDTVVAVSTIKAINQGVRIETGLNLKNAGLTTGIDYENIYKDGERVKSMIMQPGLPVKTEILWNNALINNFGLFAEYSHNFNSVELIGAARIDFNQAESDEIVIRHSSQGEIYRYSTDSIKSDFVNFSFSLGLTKHFNNNLSMSLSLGRGVRSPDMIERFITLLPIGYDKYDYLGDPQLKPEANNEADLTIKYTGNDYGLMQFNIFYSLINNYITGKLVPPSVQKPLSKDVLGVKQFYNAGNAKMYGLEFSYALPSKYRLGLNVSASYTAGTIDKTTIYIKNSNGDIIGDEELINDRMSEIPPFELTAVVKYKFLKNKLIPKFTFRIVDAQIHVSESQFEKTTPGFYVANISVFYRMNKYFSVSGGINNIFDKAYYEHLNRNIIGSNTNLYEPGRVFFINLMFHIQ